MADNRMLFCLFSIESVKWYVNIGRLSEKS